MIKQIVALIAISVVVILSMSYSQQVVQFILVAHDWLSGMLTHVFTGGHVGNIARGLIGLIAFPVIVALIPTLLYWMIRRHWFPYFMQIVWVVWLLQAGALLVTYNAI